MKLVIGKLLKDGRQAAPPASLADTAQEIGPGGKAKDAEAADDKTKQVEAADGKKNVEGEDGKKQDAAVEESDEKKSC